MGIFTSENIIDFGFTQIENLFITQYMLMADEVAVKTYLLAWHMVSMDARASVITNAALASKIGVTIEEIVMAWKFWEKKGLVKLSNYKHYHNNFQDDLNETSELTKLMRANNTLEFDIEFLSIRKKFIEKLDAVGQDPASKYSPAKKLDFYEQAEANLELVDYIEQLIRRPIQPHEREKLFSFVEQSTHDLEMIKFAFNYAYSNNKLNKRGSWNYVYRMLENWEKDKIYTIELAQEHIYKRSSVYKFAIDIEKITGTTGTADVFSDMIQRWKDEYEYSPALIENICKYLRKVRSNIVAQTVDDFVKDVYHMGVRTLEDFERYILTVNYARALMKDITVWINIDEMYKNLKRWYERYGYGMDTIRYILLSEKKKRGNLTPFMLDDLLEEAYNNGVKNKDDYDAYVMSLNATSVDKQKSQSNRNGYSNSYTNTMKTNKFGEFSQRTDIDLDKLVKEHNKKMATIQEK